MTTTQLQLFADYFQLHVMDEEAEDDLGEAWTKEAVSDALAVSERTLGIGTESNGDVAVLVEVLGHPPGDATDAFEHVVEASLRVPSGRIAVLGCTDYLPDAARFDVPAGFVRVRASRANPGDLSEAIEQVHLQIWPAPHSAPAVLKRWSGTDRRGSASATATLRGEIR
ncbi:hypothetical protein GT030_23715 [Streptomyces sp. SID1328]|uniref:hypothetical protein n=1 Tax=Streptomyces sp. SID1328 TaxID=2690250 RepID=UPI00136EA1DE|nr:hypothetical protein [Streptomyces sp. SID1328]MYV41792.1 hypothetical protein [Streptomyces sp. SID1328]